MLTRNSSCAMKTANVVVVVFSLLAAKYTRKRQQSGGFTTERHAWYIEIDSWSKKSFSIHLCIHPLSAHTSFILVYVPSSSSVYIRTISTAATRPRGALLTRYNIIYYIYLYKIFSNYNFRRMRLIHKSRFACSGKSKENMSAFPPFRFWFSFEIWPDRSLHPHICPPPYQPALVIVSSLLQRHTIALRYFLRRNCSH